MNIPIINKYKNIKLTFLNYFYYIKYLNISLIIKQR